MSGVYGFWQGPAYRASTREELFSAALDQPMSLGSTFWDQAKGGVLESFGLGTVTREMSLPPAAPGRWYGDTDKSYAERRKNYKTITEDEYKASPYFRDNVPWDDGMTEDRAAALAAMYDAKRVREYFAEKRPITAFFGNLAGQAVDPVNYIPVAGPSVRAAAVARMGLVKGVAATAALDAAANTAIAGLATRETRRGYGDDVSWQAMISEIATAALIGSAFGTVGGVLERRAGIRADALRRDAEVKVQTLKATQEARIALNEAIGGLATDGEVRLSPNATAPIERVASHVPARLDTEPGVALANAGYDLRQLADDIGEVDAVMRAASAEDAARAVQNQEIASAKARLDELKSLKPTANEYASGLVRTNKAAANEKVYEFGTSSITAAERKAEIAKEAGRLSQLEQSKSAGVVSPDILEAVRTGRAAMPERKLLPHDSSLNRTASWVIRDKASGKAVMETFNPALVEKVNTAKYEAVPIGQYLGEINGQPKRAIDTSPPRPDPIPEGRTEAEAKVAKPENYKALADQYRVDPETGTFPEEAELRQLAQEGRLSEDDMAVLDDADAAYQDGASYGEALKSVVGCLL